MEHYIHLKSSTKDVCKVFFLEWQLFIVRAKNQTQNLFQPERQIIHEQKQDLHDLADYSSQLKCWQECENFKDVKVAGVIKSKDGIEERKTDK